MRSLQVERVAGKFVLFVLSQFIWTTFCFGQVDEEPPVSPVLTMVTINQVTGDTELRWTPGNSPDVAGFIVYLYQSGAGFALDTIKNPSSTGFSVYRPYSLIRSEKFVVAAIDDSMNVSPLSNAISTIFCRATVDSCNKTIEVSWNKYASFPSKVTGYDILRSVNRTAFTVAGQTTANDSSFVTTDFINGTEYCFAVRARLENGLIPYSNKSCVTAKIPKSPGWINADYATVTAFDDISLSFTIDPASEIDLFSLERKTGSDGSYEQIAQIRTTVKSISYFDQEADAAKHNFYRLSAINSCGLKEKSSNIASNMVLDAVRETGNKIIIKWSSYYKWRGSISSYRIFIDTGSGFTQKAETEPADTSYSIDLSEAMQNITMDKICFYVLAEEEANPYDIVGESMSNQSCFSVAETITVPNIFTPNGDLKNDLFAPVLTFNPSDYHLIICDRQGKVVFETRDLLEAWDGSVDNRSPEEDVYLWYVKARTGTGMNISRTGTVTVYRNK